MLDQELCDGCTVKFPQEFSATCATCGSVLCPQCDEDGHACEQPVELPLAA